MTKRTLIKVTLVVLLAAGLVIGWRRTGPRLVAGIDTVPGPTSVPACQALVRQNLGYNEDVPRCGQEVGMPWVRVTVRNVGHRGTPDFNCTATVTTNMGWATVDLPRLGGLAGVPVAVGQSVSWVTYVPVPAYAPVQSWSAECKTIANPPI